MNFNAQIKITPGSFISYFEGMEDYRTNRRKLHSLVNILVIALCAILSGCEAWTEVSMYGKEKREWLEQYLKLPNGIPSHDTFGRVFAAIDPAVFKLCFINWMKDSLKLSEETIIALDGKTVRRSHDKDNGKEAIHMVSAYATDAGLVLGQIKTAVKSNEITAIPKLLDILDIQNCIITIDAMGCQKNIASKICSKKADYVLALKGNQGTLLTDVELYFQDAYKSNFKGYECDHFQALEKSHGRIEKRSCYITNQVDWLKTRGHSWPQLTSIAMIESNRTIKDTTTTEYRYYISSLSANAKKMNHTIRSHWAIENKLHWVLDMNFREDECRVRKDHGPENFAVLRHAALNILKLDTSLPKKPSLRMKQKIAGWNNSYLARLIFGVQVV